MMIAPLFFLGMNIIVKQHENIAVIGLVDTNDEFFQSAVLDEEPFEFPLKIEF